LLKRLLAACWILALAASSAHASFLSGEALDTAADILALVVLFMVPVVVIVLFWIVHVLPEKIAHKRHHPQTQAITTLCLLSLVFGGLLWPVAWLWAYSKPVFYKMAYGTDTIDHHAAKAPEPIAPPAATLQYELPPVATTHHAEVEVGASGKR
jgi:CBS domain containing-hemolysin-like protein